MSGHTNKGTLNESHALLPTRDTMAAETTSALTTACMPLMPTPPLPISHLLHVCQEGPDLAAAVAGAVAVHQPPLSGRQAGRVEPKGPQLVAELLKLALGTCIQVVAILGSSELDDSRLQGSYLCRRRRCSCGFGGPRGVA